WPRPSAGFSVQVSDRSVAGATVRQRPGPAGPDPMQRRFPPSGPCWPDIGGYRGVFPRGEDRAVAMAMTGVVKDELSRVPVVKPCCRKTEVSTLLRFAGGLTLT